MSHAAGEENEIHLRFLDLSNIPCLECACSLQGIGGNHGLRRAGVSTGTRARPSAQVLRCPQHEGVRGSGGQQFVRTPQFLSGP